MAAPKDALLSDAVLDEVAMEHPYFFGRDAYTATGWKLHAERVHVDQEDAAVVNLVSTFTEHPDDDVDGDNIWQESVALAPAQAVELGLSLIAAGLHDEEKR